MSDSILKVMSDINKHFGKSVMHSASEMPYIDRLKCGVPVIDYIMGGGFAINRMTELYGPWSSTKSMLAYLALGAGQRFDWLNKICDGISDVKYKRSVIKTKVDKDTIEQDFFEITGWKGVKKDSAYRRSVLIDYEATYDKKWGETLGIDNKGLIRIVPDRGSELVDIVETLLSDPSIGIIVIDSVGAASSDLEIDASAEDEQMGVNARFWNKAMRKFQSAINTNPENYITPIIINRPYAKIGMVFGIPEETSSGSGLKFGKAVSVRLTPLAPLKQEYRGEKEVEVGRMIRAKCVKNKTARPYLEGEFYLSFVDDGTLKPGEVDRVSQLVALGIKEELVSRAGAFYQYGEHKKIQGREAFSNWLRDSGLANELESKIFTNIG